MFRWTIFVVVLSVVCVNQSYALDFNNTMVHYFTTRSNNLELELSRLRSRVSLVKEKKDRDILSFRFDYVEPDSDNDDIKMLFGLFGFQSGPIKKDDFRFGFFGGATFFDLGRMIEKSEDETEYKSMVTIFNLAAGGVVDFREWVAFKAGISANVMTLADDIVYTDENGDVSEPGETFWDLDKLVLSLSSPLLGLYGKGQVDFVSKSVTDVEVGVMYDLSKWYLGIIRGAVSRRSPYTIEGLITRGDQTLGPNGDGWKLGGDWAGVLELERMGPLWKLDASAGLAVGNMKGNLRYAFTELGVQVHKDWRLVGRVGKAYSRLDDDSFFGWFLGGDYLMAGKGRFNGYFRVGVGRRDYEFVDRIGDLGSFAVSASLGAVF